MKIYLISLGLFFGIALLQMLFVHFVTHIFFRNIENVEFHNFLKKERWNIFVDGAYNNFFNTFIVFCGAIVAALLLFYTGKVSTSEMSKYLSVFVYVCINTSISLFVLAVFKGINTARNQESLKKYILEKKIDNSSMRIKNSGLMVTRKVKPFSYITRYLYKPIGVVYILIVVKIFNAI